MTGQGPLSGKILEGKYLLGNVLGTGGFGTVYSAQHLLLNRSQAIKILSERYVSDQKFRERLFREAQMLATLDHPSIVHIDDFILKEQEAQAYLVMPLIAGGTLRDVLQKNFQALPLEQVLHYLEQLCAALDYAHQRNIVHLDLKPRNLLLHADGQLLLSDFGLAHLIKQEELEGGSSLLYGTPHYKAPEHWKGKPEKRSDIYALGLILYEMLTKQRPFGGTTPEALMMQHLLTQPPLLRSLRPDLSEEVENIVRKTLAKEPSQRYQSAGALIEAFREGVKKPSQSVIGYHIQQRVSGRKSEQGQKKAGETGRLPKQQLQMFEEPGATRNGKEGKQNNSRKNEFTLKFALSKLSVFLQPVLWFLEVTLLIRFVLKMFGADPSSLFANFIFSLSLIMLAPFNNILPSLSLYTGQAFEFPTLLAMAVYFFIWFALRRFPLIHTSEPKVQ